MPQLQRICKYHTKVTRTDQGLTVDLYSTRIVTVNGNKVKLDYGMRKTATTKNRMNQTSNQYNLGFWVNSAPSGMWRVIIEDLAESIPFRLDSTAEFTIAHSLDQGGDHG